jgi:hypothetical protein
MKNKTSLKPIVLAAVAALAGVAVSSAPSQARDGRNAAAAAGVVGGIAAGAAIAGAASQPRYVEPGYGYYAPVRERRVIVDEDDGQDCYVRTRRVYVNGVMRVRRTTVCE